VIITVKRWQILISMSLDAESKRHKGDTTFIVNCFDKVFSFY